MTIRQWQSRHTYTNPQAAAKLGVSLATYKRLLNKPTMPILVKLAMKQIDEEMRR